jgi:hypothetical protein
MPVLVGLEAMASAQQYPVSSSRTATLNQDPQMEIQSIGESECELQR